jgi:hypothetical protein
VDCRLRPGVNEDEDEEDDDGSVEDTREEAADATEAQRTAAARVEMRGAMLSRRKRHENALHENALEKSIQLCTFHPPYPVGGGGPPPSEALLPLCSVQLAWGFLGTLMFYSLTQVAGHSYNIATNNITFKHPLAKSFGAFYLFLLVVHALFDLAKNW